MKEGVFDVSCSLVFVGFAVVTTLAVGPALFYCFALTMFCSFYFSSTLLFFSYISTIFVHAIFEVADDVGEGFDLADDRVVGLCGICHLG